MVSVIIPCYNNAGVVEAAVRSVLGQTYTDIEVIVVDDGSDDKPAEALARISDSRFRGVVALPHGGVSQARNRGLELARGEWVVFVDGDDLVEPTHLQQLLQGTLRADCAITGMMAVYPDRTEINETQKRVAAENPLIRRQDFDLLFYSYLLSSPCNKIYRREIIEKESALRFDTKVSYAEDLLFNLQYFSRIGSVAMLPCYTYRYIKNPGSSSGRYHKNTLYTLQRLVREASRLLGDVCTPGNAVMMMRQFLWGIMNLYHRDCTLSPRQRRNELRGICSLPEFKGCLKYLNQTGVGKPMTLLLKTRNAHIIDWALRKFKL